MAEANAPAAENISKLIRDRGLKQAFVAKRAGYTPQELCDMLNGRKLIKVCDILKLARSLDVGIEEICNADKEERR